MTSTTLYNGRLCNQIFRNIAVSLIAEKNNLYVNYANYNAIIALGIPLFVGTMKYDNEIILNEDNYFEILNSKIVNNLNANDNYFQTKEISNVIYNYLNTHKLSIININPFTNRYNNNNDLFIHIRLDDAAHNNPGINYYLNTIKTINYTNLYIATDQSSHQIIKDLVKEYPDANLINYNEIITIQFGSTCKHIILSHGSFSAIIGYLSFCSNVYYPKYEENKIWYGDMFSINNWYKITNF
jgi:hypothetical protein